MPLFLRHGRPGGSLSALHCDSIINFAGQDERFAFISTLGHIRQDSKIRSWNRFVSSIYFRRNIIYDWRKAYRTARGFFQPGTPVFDQMKFDETEDLSWRLKALNSNYAASASFFRFLKFLSTSFMDLSMYTKIFLPNSFVWMTYNVEFSSSGMSLIEAS